MSATITGVLPAAQPFDLRRSVRFLENFGACRGDQLLTEDSITKAIAIDGQAVVFKVTPAEDGVKYLLHSDSPISDETHRRIRFQIDGYLSLSDDLAAFYAIAATDHPEYARLVGALNGLHHVRFLTVAEIGVWAILSQRTPMSVAAVLKRRVTETYGRRIDFEGATYRAFPELSDLAKVPAGDWLPLVRNSRKAGYLPSLVEGLLDIGESYLRTAPYEEASAALRTIKGVGEFSAAAILLRGLGRMDHVPLEMPSFVAVTARLYGPGDHAGELRERYGRHLGYWAYYLHTGIGALREEAGVRAAGSQGTSTRRPRSRPALSRA
jgi:DNA-3-methyladenine glycosylase II